jgi:hypothetical protein
LLPFVRGVGLSDLYYFVPFILKFKDGLVRDMKKMGLVPFFAFLGLGKFQFFG